MQDVMLEVWRKADRVDWLTGNPCGFAATIARRRTIDRIRSEQAQQRRELRALLREPQQDVFIAEDVLVRLDGDSLVEALDVLSDKQREAIVLAFFGDHTYIEVARLLGLPVGTVKRRIRDGLLRLRARLAHIR